MNAEDNDYVSACLSGAYIQSLMQQEVGQQGIARERHPRRLDGRLLVVTGMRQAIA